MQTCLIKTKEFYATHVTENSRRVIPQSGSNTAQGSLPVIPSVLPSSQLDL